VASPAFSAAAAVAPDAITADLLAKHSAGEKLTASEYGKLGAWKSKLKGIFGGTNGAKPEPATSRLGASLGLGALAPGEAPGDGLGAVPPDPALCVRTTAAILRRVDVVTTKYVEREARAAFAGDERKVARFAASAALSADDRQLVADLSPDILSELGIDPGSYPFLTAAGILGAHACSLWLLVDELRKERVEREAAKGKESK
jgi:hypothetical protein